MTKGSNLGLPHCRQTIYLLSSKSLVPWPGIKTVPSASQVQSLNHGPPVESPVQSSRSVVSASLQPHGLKHTRLPCPPPTPGACSNSCPSSWWCHPTISSSVVSFSSCLQPFPASGYFQMTQFFASGGQSIGVSASASVLSMNIQEWFPLELTDLISLQSKGISREH